MNVKKVLSTILCSLLLTSFSSVYPQEEMSLKEYHAKLDHWKQRQAKTDSVLKQLDEEIAKLKAELLKTEGEIKQTGQEIYELIEANEAEVEEFRQKLEELEKKVDALEKKTAESQFDLRKKMNHDVASCWKDKISTLSDVHARLSLLEKKMVLINLKTRDSSTKK